MIKMLMTTVGMTASDTARYGLYTPNVTVAIDGLKYTTDIDRMIEVLTATVAIRAMNTAETTVCVLRM
jgi:hypothetical protein